MARDADTQHYGNTGLPDFGTVTLGDDGTADVDVLYRTLCSGIAVHKSGHTVASSLTVGALSDGTVTITDSAGAANAGAVVNYQFIGLP